MAFSLFKHLDIIIVGMSEITLSKKDKAIKILSIIVFSLIMSALLTALISDGIILSKQLFGFIFALVASAIVFVFAIICMIISIMLIFGAYLLKSEGFWPMKWTVSAYKSIMADYVLTAEQIHSALVIRIILLVICVIVFIASIVALAMLKRAKKNNKEIKRKMETAFSVLALIFSIFGMIVCLGATALLSSLR